MLKILSGKSDANIEFFDIIYFLKNLEFKERINGSHHIFYKKGVEEIINIQANKNNNGKSYQVKQIRNLILKYKLGDLDYE